MADVVWCYKCATPMVLNGNGQYVCPVCGLIQTVDNTYMENESEAKG